MPGVKGVISARSKQYWINKGYSEDDAVRYARSRMPGTYEYYRYFKKLSHEESNKSVTLWRETHKCTKELFIKRHGEYVGVQKWNEYVKQQALTNTAQYKKEKYGWTDGDVATYNKSRSITIDNMIKKYGIELGTEKWNSYVEKQRRVGCTLDYFIEKYGNVDGPIKYTRVNMLKSHSYDAYLIQCNGDVDRATEKFQSYWADRFPLTKAGWSASNISQQLFMDISNEISNHTLYYLSLNQEWCLLSKAAVRYLDFFDRSVGKVIEFYGDYWHANPRIYKPDDVIKYPNKITKAAKDVWAADADKIQFLKKFPYINDILIVWETDYRKNPSLILNECVKFLTSN